jgi:hypothetical protein
MKLDYPYKAATAEEDATVLPHPDLPGCTSFRRTGMGGELANATATFEEAALSHNPGTGLPEPSAPRRWDSASNRNGNRLVLSPLPKTRESAWLPGMLSCEKVPAPREVTLIALIS